MPSVKKGESRNAYVSRAVHMMVHREGLTPKHAVGKAEGMYDSYKKNSSRRQAVLNKLSKKMPSAQRDKARQVALKKMLKG